MTITTTTLVPREHTLCPFTSNVEDQGSIEEEDPQATILSRVPAGVEAHRLHLILTTALNEYIKARTPVHTYVADRYRDLGEDFRAKKVKRIMEDFEILEKFAPNISLIIGEEAA